MAFPVSSGAHAVLLASEPAHASTLQESPQTIVLRFNATLEEAMTRVHLVDMDNVKTHLNLEKGSSVDQIVVNLPVLPSGVYTVVYKVLARDGHVTQGTIRFTILKR